MTNLRPSLRSSRRRALLALAAVALVAAACNPFAPSTPTPQGQHAAGTASVALTTSR